MKSILAQTFIIIFLLVLTKILPAHHRRRYTLFHGLLTHAKLRAGKIERFQDKIIGVYPITRVLQNDFTKLELIEHNELIIDS